jgi:hypothetical protein
MTRIVTTVHRYKRPPPKRKAVPLTGPAIVRAVKRGDLRQKSGEPTPISPTPPANDDAKPSPKQPAIVTTTSRKQAKLDRARPDRPEEDPQADAAMREWLERRGPG